MKTREQAADEWVEKYAFRVPYNGTNDFYDKEAIRHGTAGFLAGCEFEAQNSRDFYLLVRELFQLYDNRYYETKGDHCPFTAAVDAEKIKVIIMLKKEIKKRLAAFTSREIESLPFKD